MGLIVSMLENMQGLIDQDMPQLMYFIIDELKFVATLPAQPKNYKSMIL
jgi:hypothetical protein